ncbi:hypothetical protein JCM10213v2_003232 [Rhodosporidiobolus nylandii]
MLLFLPVEIVERIVRFAVPQAYSSATYLERQDTLRSLCLVCRDLFPLAQRVLEETVRVSKPGTAKKVEQLLEDDAERARMLVLALQGYEIEAVKRGCAGLRDVQLSWVQDLQLGWLEQSRTHPTILLTYLLLPTHCRPSNLPHGDLRTSVETFLFACTSRNIAVDFEDTDESPGGSLTSPRFEAYMAEKRAREGGDNKHGG